MSTRFTSTSPTAARGTPAIRMVDGDVTSVLTLNTIRHVTGVVTINNCALTPISVHNSDIAVQVDIMHNVLPQRKEQFEKTWRTSTNSIGIL